MTTNRICALSSLVIASVLAACEAEPPAPPEPIDQPLGVCGHALYVITSDYQSSAVSVVSFDGEVLVAPFLSSASETPGLSVALSGDVVAPLSTTSGELILIDRFPAGVLTFADPKSGTVVAQTDVSTGFASNPQDALELKDGRIAVARYGENPTPGQAPFDSGSDLLLLDGASHTIVGQVELRSLLEDAELLPRPARLARNDEEVFVLLAAYSKDFLSGGDGRLAVLDGESLQLVNVIELSGGLGCGALALAPSKNRLAVGCSGSFSGTSEPTLEDSALFILDRAESGWALTRTIPAQELGQDPLSASIAFASETVLLAATFGRLADSGEQERPDRLLAIDLESAQTEELLATPRLPFSFGDVRCCEDWCFLTDADRSVLHRWNHEGGSFTGRRELQLEDGIGLPPRTLGAY